MAASSEFSFLALPFEIRKHIYQTMLEGQAVHWCPDERHEHHHRPTFENGLVNHFFDDLMRCSSNSHESLSYEVRWTSVVHLHSYLPSPSHILNFLLSCKTVWSEMEPLLWKYMTFCVGLHHFAGFYERFLAQERSNHPITNPRAQLLQRISVALVERLALADSISNDARFRHVSSFAVVEKAKTSSIGYLREQCTCLQHLTALVNAPIIALGERYTAGAPALGFEDSLTILQFRGLKSFKLMVHGPIDRSDSEITYHSAPSTHPMKLAFGASQLAMAEIVTRSVEPPGDEPPAGISLTDPDYLWLKEMHEQDGGRYPRLGELILRTKLHLKERGIEMPPVSEINF